MGLDMYMYKVQSVSREEADSLVGLHLDNIREKYGVIYKSDVDQNQELYLDILPYAQEIVAIARVFDEDQFRKDNGIALDDLIVGQGVSVSNNGQEISYIFESGKTAKLSLSEYNRYSPEQDIMVYVYKKENVAYWRNEHDLNDFISVIRCAVRTRDYVLKYNEAPSDDDLYDWKVHNCGMYILNNEEKRAVYDYLQKYKSERPQHYEKQLEPLLQNDDMLAYYAWW